MTMLQLHDQGKRAAGELAVMQIAVSGPAPAVFLLRGMVVGLMRALRILTGSKETAEFLYQLADQEVEAAREERQANMDPVRICEAIKKAVMEPSHG